MFSRSWCNCNCFYLITIWTCYTRIQLTPNKNLYFIVLPCTKWEYSGNCHSDVVDCKTLETSLNDLSLWCIGSCVGSHYTPTDTGSEQHCNRCHTHRWCCSAPGHSNTRSWTIHTLSTCSNSMQWKPISCMHAWWMPKLSQYRSMLCTQLGHLSTPSGNRSTWEGARLSSS